MNHNDIIIYGFNFGNADPAFKEFVYSLTNYDIHNLRLIIYKRLYNLEQNSVSAAIHGRDSYGIIIVPEIRKNQIWEKSDKLLFDYIKNLWVASVLGYSDPGLNPFKIHEWKITRIRAVTSRNEGWEAITSALIEIGLAYITQIQLIRSTGMVEKGYTLKALRDGGGKVNGFSISVGSGYGTKPRLDYHTLYNASRTRNSIPEFLREKKVLHYHRGTTNKEIRRHLPWEFDPTYQNFWDRFR
ncbi:hypothetical protein [Dysgonomonas sp. HGC4]|uniref:hypothetical protein n=1 Tax=Dysgonomonas sp. HGC4 TaxID=1658009 RepID=UPI000682BE00|nr:hypothetical protein [Dysgonomonas sp. HGC4]MBD8346771.1 hypothetical protein [Dysgonomonas sp. HGC4]